MPPKVFFASHNAGKIAEVQAMLAERAHVLSPKEIPDCPASAEQALTFVENALDKARLASEHTGLPTLADDSGLVVPHLNGKPGLHSSRFAGLDATAEDNNQKLLAKLDGCTGVQRKAYFMCVLVLIAHPDDPAPLIAEGRWWGSIVSQPRGSAGFGYDPLFLCPEHQKTAAELTAEEKNKISHRAKALQNLLMQWQT